MWAIHDNRAASDDATATPRSPASKSALSTVGGGMAAIAGVSRVVRAVGACILLLVVGRRNLRRRRRALDPEGALLGRKRFPWRGKLALVYALAQEVA